MALPSIAKPPLRHGGSDPAKWVVVAVLATAALVTIMLTRQLTGPLDGLLTQQVCSAYGEEIGRPATGSERSIRFALLNRSEGMCFYGPPETEEDGDEGASADPAVASGDADPAVVDELAVPFDEAQPGAFYRAGKVMALLLQLGAASAVVRGLADPLLDRFVRRPD